MNPNDSQKLAISTSKGPLLIIAGAGSGKTTTLTLRIQEMIRQGYSPNEILAIAFTNKAVGEMRKRISSVLGDSITEKVWLSTFHSLCLSILRSEFSSSVRIASQSACRQVVRNILSEQRLNDSFSVKDVIKWISLYKSELVSAKILKNNKLSKKIHRLKKLQSISNEIGSKHFYSFICVFSMYQKRLLDRSMMDVDDILLKTVFLFIQKPEILDKYQEQFKYIMVDEYQDTNHAQYLLVRLLAKKYRNLCVVGDDHQSIFGFRGANIQNILRFRSDFPDAVEVKFEQNYRSSEIILQAANELIAHNPNQTTKTLYSVYPGGEKIHLTTPDFAIDEAEYVGEKIQDFITKGFSYQDMAVFYRNNSDASHLETVFPRLGIPYSLSSNESFLDRDEIRDVLAYLEFLQNPNNAFAFTRIVNIPKRSVGTTTIKKIIDQSGNESFLPLCENSDTLERVNSKTKLGLQEFAKIIKKLQCLSKQGYSVSSLLTEILSETKYFQLHLSDVETYVVKEKKAFLDKLIQIASEWDVFSISAFLEQIRHKNVDQVFDSLTDQNVVTLSTLHSAKGLEFPIVFITGMTEGSLPSEQAISSAGVEEERRLCFVGFTRAKRYLLLSYSKYFFEKIGKDQKLKKKSVPSRFLAEFDPNLLLRS